MSVWNKPVKVYNYESFQKRLADAAKASKPSSSTGESVSPAAAPSGTDLSYATNALKQTTETVKASTPPVEPSANAGTPDLTYQANALNGNNTSMVLSNGAGGLQAPVHRTVNNMINPVGFPGLQRVSFNVDPGGVVGGEGGGSTGGETGGSGNTGGDTGSGTGGETGGMSYADYERQQKDDALDAEGERHTNATTTINNNYESNVKDIEEDQRKAKDQAATAYDHNQSSYGAKAERIAQMGLTGSGYSDYLDSQAYAQYQGSVASADSDAANLKQDALETKNEKLAAEDLLYSGNVKDINTTYTDNIQAYAKEGYTAISTGIADGSIKTTEELDTMAAKYGLSDEDKQVLYNLLAGSQKEIRNEGYSVISKGIADGSITSQNQIEEYMNQYGLDESYKQEFIDALTAASNKRIGEVKTEILGAIASGKITSEQQIIAAMGQYGLDESYKQEFSDALTQKQKEDGNVLINQELEKLVEEGNGNTILYYTTMAKLGGDYTRMATENIMSLISQTTDFNTLYGYDFSDITKENNFSSQQIELINEHWSKIMHDRLLADWEGLESTDAKITLDKVLKDPRMVAWVKEHLQAQYNYKYEPVGIGLGVKFYDDDWSILPGTATPGYAGNNITVVDGNGAKYHVQYSGDTLKDPVVEGIDDGIVFGMNGKLYIKMDGKAYGIEKRDNDPEKNWHWIYDYYYPSK